MFRLSYLQATEVDSLSKSDKVIVEIDPELDNKGFNRVDVVSDSRESIVEYVRENWGDEDPDWFREYVVEGIVEAPLSFAAYLIARLSQGPLGDPAEGDDLEVEEFDPESESFYGVVESAWYDEAKGELWLSRGDDANNPEEVDDELRAVVTVLARESVTFIKQNGIAQVDADGDDINGPVPQTEIARRIAVSLSVLWNGGR